MPLQDYHKKRDFTKTSEPRAGKKARTAGRRYVIQKHAARRLHYDLRLELAGVLKSWAVPKGPSLDPTRKRLAVHVEDHPLDYVSFEGTIPKGEYGGGTVMVWDQGTWEPLEEPGKGLSRGDLKFRLYGRRLKGSWVLARMSGKNDGNGKNWLLIKKKDSEARSGRSGDVSEFEDRSVLTGRTMEEITSGLEADMFRVEDLARLPGARKSDMPDRPSPQMAVLAKEAPAGEEWLHEIKYDGYRILCLKKNGRVRLITRNGKDWTDKFEEVVQAAHALPLDQCVIDGEIVVLRPDGKPDFQALQNVLKGEKTGRPGYYVFDILHASGFDLTPIPLLDRKKILKKILRPAPRPLIYGDYIRGSGDRVFAQVCRMGLEGIVSKKADSRYEQRRSRSWIKIKCKKSQEFVISGYSEPSGSRRGFGALLLGYHDSSGRLIYAGRVGTGFNEKTLKQIHAKLTALKQSSSPLHNPPGGRETRKVHWVRPQLVAEVEFSGWTNDRLLRQASFKGLRQDKPPGEIILETPQASNKPAVQGNPHRAGNNSVAGVTLSNPRRILYPEQGLTKQDLAGYYEKISDWILPHLMDRPLTLVRCPEGHQKQCFYQKHLADQLPETLLEVPIREKGELRSYVALQDLPGLISLVQLGVLEIHPWGGRRDNLERPDRMIFDLDPGPGVQPRQLTDVTKLLHAFLDELDLAGFLKTSGGKGFHVVVPLDRRSGWNEVKDFARKIAREMAQAMPNLVIAVMNKSRRRGKIFIDYLRNGRGATTVAPYSTRAGSGAPVSTPIAWEELQPGLSPDQFNVHNLSSRLVRPYNDPWSGFFDVRQSISKKRKKRLGL